MIIMNTESGKVETTLPIGMDNDATRFDRGHAFASYGDGTPTVIGERNGRFEVEQTVKTAAGARTMGLDHSTQQIFLPTVEILPAEPRPSPATQTRHV